MATASATQVKRTITLSLSEEEAETLRTICGHITGDPRTSRRRHADEILRVLEGLGVANLTADVEGRAIIRFN